MKDLWVQDIMTQKFLDSDITRILLLYALTKKDMERVYKKNDVLEYIYRAYADNPSIAIVNPNIRIRNIKRYGVSEIRDVLEQALLEWKNYAMNHILEYDEKSIYLNIENEDRRLLTTITIQICKMLQQKYFGISFNEPQSIPIETCRNDRNLYEFGKGIYMNRVLEDIQYCPLCEETNLDKLFAIHIMPSEYCNDMEIIDKNNGLVLCETHAKEYLDKKFLFNENGFVINNGSLTVDERMHLSLQVKNRKRRDYLRRYYELLTKKK